jgi:hypothetical protein
MNEYICAKCHQPVEAGAQFCGNCGEVVPQSAVPTPTTPVPPSSPSPVAQPTVSPPASPTPPDSQASPSQVSQVYQSTNPTPAPKLGNMAAAGSAPVQASPIPSYAVPTKGHKQHRATIGLAIGIVGIFAALLIAIVGVALGIVGVVLSTTTPKTDTNKGIKLASLIVSILAIVVSLAAWVYVIEKNVSATHSASTTSAPASGSGAVSEASATTPCYTISFPSSLNVSNSSGSCDLKAYNASTLDASSNVYEVQPSTIAGLTTSEFNSTFSSSSELNKAFPGFKVSNEQTGEFAGQPDISFTSYDTTNNVTFAAAFVLHNTSAGNNNLLFVIHGQNGTSASLDALEGGWIWGND